MRTPAGSECPYFYGNYFRGRKQEECRLISQRSPSDHWSPDLCKKCPVPAIHRANACENMILSGKVEKSFLNLRRQVKITAWCKLSQKDVIEPRIGCGQCHSITELIKGVS